MWVHDPVGIDTPVDCHDHDGVSVPFSAYFKTPESIPIVYASCLRNRFWRPVAFDGRTHASKVNVSARSTPAWSPT